MDPVISKTVTTTNYFNLSDGWIALPDDLVTIIVKDYFQLHNIKQFYIFGRVCKKWSVIIENNFDHIFKIAKDVLKLKEEKGKPFKLLVFEGIQTLRKQCEIGKQKLIESPNEANEYHLSNNERNTVKEAQNGFNANLFLTHVGQSTWKDVMQYIPALTRVSNLASVDTSDSENDVDESDRPISLVDSLRKDLSAAMTTAVRKGFFDEATNIYQKTSWGEFENKAKATVGFLYYCYINQQFDQANKFCTNFLKNPYFDVAQRVSETCQKLHPKKNLEILNQITSQVLPGLEDRALKLREEQLEKYGNLNGNQGLKELFWLFNIYILNDNFKNVNDLLNKYPELADQMLQFYVEWRADDPDEDKDPLPQTVKIFLDEFKDGTLSKHAKTLDQELDKMIQKLNKNTGLKRSYPFENPFAVDDVKNAEDGLATQLKLFNIGKCNWSDVQKYIPVLIIGSQAQGLVDRCKKVLLSTFSRAINRDFINDALTIYREMQWENQYKIALQGGILLYYYLNKELEKAEQFLTEEKLNDLEVTTLVLLLCGDLFKEDNFEEAEQLASMMLPLRAKGAKDSNFEEVSNARALENLVFVLYHDNNTKLNEYLSNREVSLGEDFEQLMIKVRQFKTRLDEKNKDQTDS